MKTTPFAPASIRMNERTRRHLIAATKYFGCRSGALVELLLDATCISKLDETQLPEEIIEKFYQHLNDNAEEATYLFKD